METLEELKNAWNAQADKYNQWDELGHDEIVAFAQQRAAAAERERMCAAIKAADDKASEGDYMLDSDNCISVIRGTWNPEA